VFYPRPRLEKGLIQPQRSPLWSTDSFADFFRLSFSGLGPIYEADNGWPGGHWLFGRTTWKKAMLWIEALPCLARDPQQSP